MPAMAVAAEATTQLRLGCRVFCIEYRPPVMLAKEAATLDLLWPAVLVAMYHGLASQHAGVLGRDS